MWKAVNNRLTHDDLPGPMTMIMAEPFPPFWWYSDCKRLTHTFLPSVQKTGAFCGCIKLEKVNIPESVKSIGEYAFADTSLKKVTIASDCQYYDTSFPEGCIINYYPDCKDNADKKY